MFVKNCDLWTLAQWQQFVNVRQGSLPTLNGAGPQLPNGLFNAASFQQYNIRGVSECNFVLASQIVIPGLTTRIIGDGTTINDSGKWPIFVGEFSARIDIAAVVPVPNMGDLYSLTFSMWDGVDVNGQVVDQINRRATTTQLGGNLLSETINDACFQHLRMGANNFIDIYYRFSFKGYKLTWD